ncbi:hypothetical protein, partial [Escherichia coli]|uniref:hypothetical protein n=1 Tax=Escherichia coli TaxID=562 RepID=UPI00386013B5
MVGVNCYLGVNAAGDGNDIIVRVPVHVSQQTCRSRLLSTSAAAYDLTRQYTLLTLTQTQTKQ